MKPFFHQSLHIKNSHNYQDFLRRKPKHALNFKFSMIRIPQKFFPTDERAVQLKLLGVLHILKPVTKVDFGHLEALNSRSWRTTLKSAFKKNSRVKSLVLVRPQNNTNEKYFRYFARLQNLYYQLDGLHFDFLADRRHDMLFQNTLECLKCCPKIRTLEVLDKSFEGELTKISTGPPHYLNSLESFTFIARRWNENKDRLPIKFSKNLKSISLCFQNLNSLKPRTQVMKDLSALSNLQEINLRLGIDVNSAFLTACKTIAQKGMLNKVTLHWSCEVSSNQTLLKALEAFKDCKLTSFSLKTFIRQTQALESISEFIGNMHQLESLELQIFKNILFSENESKNFVEICKQINKLQALRSLKLRFHTNEEISETTRIPNFIHCLSDLFKKPIKIETFHFACNQLDPSEALQSITSLLENSASFLLNLKINFGTCSWTKKASQAILQLMQKLSKVQVLENPSLEFNAQNVKSLKEIIEAIFQLKYLRVISFGNLKKTIPQSTLCRVVETISSKRGLRRFSCGEAGANIESDFKKETIMINMKNIIERNPYFEFLDFNSTFDNAHFVQKLYNWDK